MCVADTTDFGILRLIADDSEKARSVLKQNGLTVKKTEVAAVPLTHKPGSLNGVLREFEKAGVSIEYLYAFTSRSAEYDAIVVLKLADQDAAMEKLKTSGINFIGQDVIDKMNN